MKLNLEFVDRRRLPWGSMAFCLVAALCCAKAVADWFTFHEAQRELLVRIAAVERSIDDAKRMPATVAAKVESERKVQEQLRESLAYPWNRVLAEVEQVASHDVAILSLTHAQGLSGTQLAVEALDVGALARFVDRLNEDAQAKNWYLASYRVEPLGMPPTVKGIVLSRSNVAN